MATIREVPSKIEDLEPLIRVVGEEEAKKRKPKEKKVKSERKEKELLIPIVE